MKKIYCLIMLFINSAYAAEELAANSMQNFSSSVSTTNISNSVGAASSSLSWMIICTIGIVALIYALSYLLKKFKLVPSLTQADKFRVLSTVAVGTKEKIVLLKAGDDEILVGVTPNNISYLYTLNKNGASSISIDNGSLEKATDDKSSSDSNKNDFQNVLNKVKENTSSNKSCESKEDN